MLQIVTKEMLTQKWQTKVKRVWWLKADTTLAKDYKRKSNRATAAFKAPDNRTAHFVKSGSLSALLIQPMKRANFHIGLLSVTSMLINNDSFSQTFLWLFVHSDNGKY